MVLHVVDSPRTFECLIGNCCDAQEIELDKNSRCISFRNLKGARFNCWYLSGTVGTVCDHPFHGKVYPLSAQIDLASSDKSVLSDTTVHPQTQVLWVVGCLASLPQRGG